MNTTITNEQERSLLFLLSAKSKSSLNCYIELWLEYLKKQVNIDLASLAFTLQTGRELMACRLAITASSQAELVANLSAWLADPTGDKKSFFGGPGQKSQFPPDFEHDIVMDDFLSDYTVTNSLDELAYLWSQGSDIPWIELYEKGHVTKLKQLPTYPFEQRECWPFAQSTQSTQSTPTTRTPKKEKAMTKALNSKAAEYYAFGAGAALETFFEEYLTFCPFESRIPGFSMSKLYLTDNKTQEWELVHAKQTELRQVLFCKEDFNSISKVADIGCGHGTDVIQIAHIYSHIETNGYTITESQVELGKKRIVEKNLTGRVHIFNRDSASDKLPANNDLVIGIEVSFHIRNKQGLFSNIADSLNNNGRILLMDYITNLRGSIDDPSLDISIPTKPEWIELLTQNGLEIDEIVDVSPQIANFLYDPAVEENIKDAPAVFAEHFRNFANQATSLDNGWLSYCLFKLTKSNGKSYSDLQQINTAKMAQQTPYLTALQAMKQSNHIPYPKIVVQGSAQNLNLEQIKSQLIEIFQSVLGLNKVEIEAKQHLSELGVSSVNAVIILEAINVAYDLTMPSSVIFECSSFDDLANLIDSYKPNAVSEIQQQAQIKLSPEIESSPQLKSANNSIQQQGNVVAEIRQQLLSILQALLGLQAKDIENAMGLKELGINSVNALMLLEAINTHYDLSLPTSIVFECNTVEELAQLLSSLISSANFARSELPSSNSVSINTKVGEETMPVTKTVAKREQQLDDVAVIGISCRSAGANNPADFWDFISQGRECVDKISNPDWISFIEQNGEQKQYRYGAIDGIDEFDSLFFQISPIEAGSMDPAQRILLEASYSALEDAGYCPTSLQGQQVGTIIGCMDSTPASGGYSHLKMLGTDTSILAARIAFFLDLKGPALCVNTACSSSLVAIDIAYQKLRARSIDMSLAGGVTIYTHPASFLFMDNANMLSPNGQCRPFDNQADGIVVGDGVGVVVLKRLQDALADHDNIHGIIKGSGTNQDGRTSGITVPSFLSQSQLQASVYRQFNIDVNDLQYIEAHGTATKLGDPVEIHALTDSFSQFTANKQYCAIGSLKANIGHSTAASGVLNLIKVLLSFKHAQMPPSINFDQNNSHIDFEQSPVYVNTHLVDWPLNSKGTRLAAVNSFGFSGTNAHLVVEQANANLVTKSGSKNPEALLVFSARTTEQLKQIAQNMLMVIDNNNIAESSLADVAYTLQVGREAMEERMAFVAKDLTTVKRFLVEFVNQINSDGALLMGRVGSEEANGAAFNNAEAMQLLIAQWSQENKFQQIADAWVKGLPIEWSKLYQGTVPQRVSLPTYPFAKRKYALEESLSLTVETHNQTVVEPVTNAKIHPLVHSNQSDIYGIQFDSYFKGDEFFFTDHQVINEKVLPGVGHLEIARVAAEQALLKDIPNQSIEISNVVWTKPLAVDNYLPIRISLFQESDVKFSFEIFKNDEYADEPESLYSQGRITLIPEQQAPSLDLAKLKSQCTQETIAPSEIYKQYVSVGIYHGPAYQGLDSSLMGQTDDGKPQILAKLKLPESIESVGKDYVLNPSLMDSALQSSVGLMFASGSNQKGGLYLPFAVKNVKIFAPIPAESYVWMRHSATDGESDAVRKIDADICDLTGKICVQLTEFTSRFVSNDMVEQEPAETILLLPQWQEKAASPPIIESNFNHSVILLGNYNQGDEIEIINQFKTVNCQRISHTSGGIAERYQAYAQDILSQLKSIMSNKDKKPTLIQMIIKLGNDSSILVGLNGLLKVAVQENPKLITQSISIDPRIDSGVLVEKIKSNIQLDKPGFQEIRYHQGQRELKGFKLVEAAQNPNNVNNLYHENGVFLISGGFGGLGQVFAKNIAANCQNPTILLLGRSQLDQNKQKQMDELKSRGAKVDYCALDISDSMAVEPCINQWRSQYGDITVVLHSAGIIQDNFIQNKTNDELAKVFAPKVSGLVNLDQATQNHNVKYFVMFSSLASVLGNLGQADYATANGFMDEYARYRNTLVGQRQRNGRTVSINWPLWAEGGMNTDEAVREKMYRNGTVPLPTEDGLLALHRSIAQGQDQVAVMLGHRQALEKVFSEVEEVAQKTMNQQVTEKLTVDDQQLLEKLQNSLINEVAKLLKMQPEELDLNAELSKYGFDSLILTDFGNRLNKLYGIEILPTIFFEYPTLGSFARHLIDEYQSILSQTFKIAIKSNAITKRTQASEENVEAVSTRRRRRNKAPQWLVSETTRVVEKVKEPIAVIGMSGCFPKSENLDIFWNNLKEGKNCISEIPADRWDWRAFYGDPQVEVNKTNVKWGGFVDSIGEFDSLFFGISPREAISMDPQQRLLMSYVWLAIEDAGYAPSSLAGSQTAMLIGTGMGNYGARIAMSKIVIEGFSTTGMVASIGPNRMSFFLDIHGPSEPIETACSSSLVAIHRAMGILSAGQSEMAIVGGVNTMVTPDVHIGFNKAGMLSEDGLCKTFSSKADGYVRGEGVGMVLLKKLSVAERDGDNIYGLILSSAENHGGKANSLTAPNPKAQAALLKTAYKEAGIDPRTVSYIEAHGTGTPMGDPIEINALKSAFADLYAETGSKEITHQHCGLGSVKTNIGHLELSAGIAGFIKVMLQIKHKTLVKSLHCDEVNPYIKLEDSPFYITKETREWQALKDSEGRNIPRRAGVSSFGFGGVNTHVVLEEYVAPAGSHTMYPVVDQDNPALVILSSKTEAQLHEQANRLLTSIKTHAYDDHDLGNLAYTLQVGRESMKTRLAMTAVSIEELTQKLTAYTQEPSAYIDECYQGVVEKDQNTLSMVTSDEDFYQVVDAWIEKRRYNKLLGLWVKGLAVDWQKLYTDCQPKRISLPTYPFLKKKHWIEVADEVQIAPETNTTAAPSANSTPVQQVVSTQVQSSSLKKVTFKLQPIDGTTATPKPKMQLQQTALGINQQNNSLVQDPALVSQTATLLNNISNRQETATTAVEAKSEEELQELLADSLATSLYVERDEVDIDTSFSEIGLDSIVGVEWARWINDNFNISLPVTRLYDYSTVRKLATYLANEMANVAINVGAVCNESSISNTVETNKVSQEHVLVSIPQQPIKQLVTLSATQQSPVVKDPMLFGGLPTEDELQIVLLDSLAVSLYVEPDEIDMDSIFSEIGLDSIVGVEWNRWIADNVGVAIPVTRLYDYSTVRKLAAYIHNELIQNDRSEDLQTAGQTATQEPTLSVPQMANEAVALGETAFAKKSQGVPSVLPIEGQAIAIVQKLPQPIVAASKIATPQIAEKKLVESKIVDQIVVGQNVVQVELKEKTLLANKIAIIGMAGQFPKSPVLTTFWQNLAEGIDCITEVPEQRWPLDAFYDPDPEAPGKTMCRWLGSLEDVDKFDPLFFNISPAEAEMMDPQQRLFLQSCWSAIENASINPRQLAGSSCGVYVGCGTGDYGQGIGEKALGAHGLIGGTPSILAARISYFLDLKGPCLAIDTACSSSLVAIAEACNNLQLGNCDIALAGGVNVLATPCLHISSSKAGMLSPDGRCFTFDNRANGFVPGEAVGVVLLKPLADAQRDQDKIHGVILGWGVNQDGLTNGITAPSVESQIALEKQTFERFAVHPESISMVEAHGTGTKLGDPIEVEALTSTFKAFTNKQQYCALGSVKSNIGHTLAAAGVAGLFKVLLAMKHKQLPPTINYSTLNEHIKLDDSPFYINEALKDWDTSVYPVRRACVSSFGFSGTNAHLIVEEGSNSTALDSDKKDNTSTNAESIAVVLSAKTKAQLFDQANNLYLELQQNKGVSSDLKNVAYTLQVGRQPMLERLAFLVTSVDELLAKLQDVIVNGTETEQPFRGNSRQGRKTLPKVSTVEDLLRKMKQSAGAAELQKLLEFWVKGLDFDWRLIYLGNTPQRIELPSYPFAKEAYWVYSSMAEQNNDEMTGSIASDSKASGSFLHPLVHSNTSDLNQQKFTSIFSGNETFIGGYKTHGQSCMSFAVYMEMVRVAASRSTSDIDLQIAFLDCRWINTELLVDSSYQWNIAITASNTGAPLQFEIYIENQGSQTVVAQGAFKKVAHQEPPVVAIQALSSDQRKHSIDKDFCYDVFRKMGIVYDKEYQGLKKVYLNENKVFAEINLPGSLVSSMDNYVINPSILESAVQAAAFLNFEPSVSLSNEIVESKKDNLMLLRPCAPIKFDSFEVYCSCTTSMYASIKIAVSNVASIQQNQEQILVDLDIFNDKGAICYRLKAVAFHLVSVEQDQDTSELSVDLEAEIQQYLLSVFSAHFKISVDDIDFEEELENYGMDSIIAAQMVREFNNQFVDIPQSLFLENSTLDEVKTYFIENYAHEIRLLNSSSLSKTALVDGGQEKPALTSQRYFKSNQRLHRQSNDVAIIGMSGLYPGSDNFADFMDKLDNGKRVTSAIPQKRQALLGLTDYNKNQMGGFLDSVETFDHNQFKMSLAEAQLMDPQLRKLLEVSWRSILDAGYTVQEFKKYKTGVFVATKGHSGYMDIAQSRNDVSKSTLEWLKEPSAAYANRMSNIFDLKGPSEVIETGCAGFLVAIKHAMTALKEGRCQQAIVATAELYLSPKDFSNELNNELVSSSHVTKSFAKDSDGYVKSESIGAIVLKASDSATQSNDSIYATIKGVGVCHGGKAPLKWYSPNIKGQKLAIEEALNEAAIDPGTVSYVEPEANGSQLGDVSEIVAIQSVYGPHLNNKPNTKLKIGSMKPLSGHAETASTFTVLARILHSIRKNKLYGVQGLTEVNEGINLTEQFEILDADVVWQSNNEISNPKRAAIHSLSLGGVNAHMIIEEYQPMVHADNEVGAERLFVFSECSETNLKILVSEFITFFSVNIQQQSATWLHRVETTLKRGRQAHPIRLAVIALSVGELVEKLTHWKHGKIPLNNGTYCSTQDNKFDVSEVNEVCLSTTALNWVKGARVDWNEVDGCQNVQRISLPTNPLEKVYCWHNGEDAIGESEQASSSLGTLMLKSKWIERINQKNDLREFSTHKVILCNWREVDMSQLKYKLKHNTDLICLSLTKANIADNYLQVSKDIFKEIKKLLIAKPKKSVSLQIVLPDNRDSVVLQGLIGLLNTARQESSQFFGQLIVMKEDSSADDIVTRVYHNNFCQETFVRYQDDIRLVQSWSESDIAQVNNSPISNSTLKDNSVILITGGLGGLGYIIATEIAETTDNITLILTGSSALSPAKNTQINKLESLGAIVEYVQSDVSNKNSVESLIKFIKNSFDGLNGIIHAAGIVRDNYIIKKSLKELRSVMLPKVAGLYNLDVATANIELDFFILFSSLAGVFGNIGQGDYALSNGFMDAYAVYRSELVEQGERQGKTISINWPLWLNGGMKVDSSVEQLMKQTHHMLAMPTEVGINAFNSIVTSDAEQCIVKYGELDKMRVGLMPKG